MNPVVFKSRVARNEFKSKVEELVAVNRSDDFMSHAKAISRFNELSSGGNLIGEVKENSFSVWRYNSPLSTVFCCILSGEIYDKGEHLIVKLELKLNPVGRFLFLSFLLLLWLITALYFQSRADSSLYTVLAAYAFVLVVSLFAYASFFRIMLKRGEGFLNELSARLNDQQVSERK